MCIRVLTIFKCACPHRNTLVCPHHIHVREPSSSTSSTASSPDLSSSSKPSSPSPSRPNTSSSEPPENTTTSNDTTNTINPDSSFDDFQKGFHPRLPSALQGHKSWTPIPGKENQRWEHCPGYLAKSRALALATSSSTTTNGKSGGEAMVGKETQCAEYKATEPKFRRRWEVKTGLCGECKGVHGMDGPGASGVGVGVRDVKAGREESRIGSEAVVSVGKGMVMKGVPLGKGSETERGRARSRAATDPTVGAMPVPVPVDGAGGNVVKGVSGKVVGKRVVRKRIATL